MNTLKPIKSTEIRQHEFARAEQLIIFTQKSIKAKTPKRPSSSKARSTMAVTSPDYVSIINRHRSYTTKWPTRMSQFQDRIHMFHHI